MPDFFQDVLVFAREGFAEVNAAQGLIIAVIAAMIMSQWPRIFIIVAGAVAAHIGLDILSPVFAEVGPLRLPDVTRLGYWRYVGLLFAGYAIAISVLFAIKRVVVRR
ncbi:hypothetical protein RMQ97_08725 [Maricaulis sp. D1M11]|uniref:hypothetical protein n=1 Tax=Maricaulis sp. D1M11 TaxID=3076117 RepID=UPI0039B53906